MVTIRISSSTWPIWAWRAPWSTSLACSLPSPALAPLSFCWPASCRALIAPRGSIDRDRRRRHICAMLALEPSCRPWHTRANPSKGARDMAFGKGHHLHLIDGSAFIFRAYHALPPLTRKSDGLPIGAVSGFCNMLQKYVEGNHGPDAPTHIAVIFDKGSHTFRNDMYDQYKANREAMPEDLRPQIPLTRQATEAFNIACKEKEGFEADDIIATLSEQARQAGGRVTIISSDEDLMQLVGGGVEMLDAMKSRRIDRDGVFEKFGVWPDRVVDVQALAGDSTDNVPGAPGIGAKTAALLINEFGSLEELLDRAEEIRQPKRRETLIGHRAQIELSKRLVQLDCDMELPYGLDDLEVKDPDADTLLGFLTSMEFRTTTKRVAEALGVEAPVIEAAEQSPLEAPPVVPMDEAVYSAVTDLEALE